MDIACIKRTEGTELVFLSKDKKALFYKGEIYPIMFQIMKYLFNLFGSWMGKKKSQQWSLMH